MSETYPNKGTRETLFAGHIPSSVGFDGKITNYFSLLQIYIQKKCHICPRTYMAKDIEL